MFLKTEFSNLLTLKIIYDHQSWKAKVTDNWLWSNSETKLAMREQHPYGQARVLADLN